MAEATPEERAARRLAVGLVALCFLLAMVGRGVAESMTVFLKPLGEAFNTDRSAIAGIASLGMIAGGIGSPFAGALFDRFGPFRLYLSGIVLMLLALVGASQASELWHIYLGVGLCSGIASAMIGNAPHTALVSRWFGKRLVTALGVIHSSIGMGTLLMVPLSQWLIQNYGWRNAYLVLAGLVFLLLPSLFFVPWARAVAGNPARSANQNEKNEGFEGIRFRDALRQPAFWGLASVFFFTGGGVFSIVFQIVAYLIDRGFEPLAAASTYGIIGFIVPAGMIGFASLDRVIGPRRSVITSYSLTLTSIAMLWVAGETLSMLALGYTVIALGLSMGTRGPQVASLAARIFRGRNVGVILGAVMTGGSFGTATGIFVGGLLHDLTDGYNLVFVYSLISVSCGACPFFLVKAIREAHV